MYKKALLLSAVIALTASCSRNNFFEHQSLTVLPAQQHKGYVEVFYEGASEIPKDYVEYYDLRIVKRGNFSTQRMVEFLQEEARKKGLDAVADISHWDETEEKFTLMNALSVIVEPTAFDHSTVVNYSIITGKGVKYVENIDLSRSIKQAKIYDAGTLLGEINYQPNGLIEETVAFSDASEALLNQYYKLSEDYLLHAQDNWETLHYSDGRIDVRRQYRLNDWVMTRVRVQYNQNHPNRIKRIRLTEEPKGDTKVYKIDYHYAATGLLMEREISGATNMKQKFKYTQDKLTAMSLEVGNKVYDVSLEYYRQEDLKGMIRKVENPETEE